jgi:hypothetical protein
MNSNSILHFISIYRVKITVNKQWILLYKWTVFGSVSGLWKHMKNYSTHLLLQLHYKLCSLLESLLLNCWTKHLLWIRDCFIPQPTHCSSDKAWRRSKLNKKSRKISASFGRLLVQNRRLNNLWTYLMLHTSVVTKLPISPRLPYVLTGQSRLLSRVLLVYQRMNQRPENCNNTKFVTNFWCVEQVNSSGL